MHDDIMPLLQCRVEVTLAATVASERAAGEDSPRSKSATEDAGTQR
jgi:hypothetical protein